MRNGFWQTRNGLFLHGVSIYGLLTCVNHVQSLRFTGSLFVLTASLSVGCCSGRGCNDQVYCVVFELSIG